MASRVCPSVGKCPRGSRGCVSVDVQSTWSVADSRWTLSATLCQRRSIRASTPSPWKTQLTRASEGSRPLALKEMVPSGPLRSTESWIGSRDMMGSRGNLWVQIPIDTVCLSLAQKWPQRFTNDKQSCKTQWQRWGKEEDIPIACTSSWANQSLLMRGLGLHPSFTSRI